MTTIRLSAAAARQIQRIRARDPAAAGLRLAVEGGGCSGFQYDIQIVAAPQEGDLIIERDGERLFVDAVSLPFLADSELDWTDELIGASFKVRNPNARTSCGCGVSFTV
ncbi:MAG: iron-sulfur cluster assembly accessory protein [Hyphomonadaceae bacterium]|nr:iron-sulfur cluster assembly accessory protein [Hyphomonadaceae bacterium]